MIINCEELFLLREELAMIKESDFIKNNDESDSNYTCYNLTTSIRIFNHLIADENLEEVYIYVSGNGELTAIINYIIHYIDWFSSCENVLKSYYENKLNIKYLQKSLPSNINLECCQSCRHGNFCPYGDSDNEIFCFKDIVINSKHDVCVFFK